MRAVRGVGVRVLFVCLFVFSATDRNEANQVRVFDGDVPTRVTRLDFAPRVPSNRSYGPLTALVSAVSQNPVTSTSQDPFAVLAFTGSDKDVAVMLSSALRAAVSRSHSIGFAGPTFVGHYR